MSPEQKDNFDRYWRRKIEVYRLYRQHRLERYFHVFDPEMLLREPEVVDYTQERVRFTFKDSDEHFALPMQVLNLAFELGRK